MDVVLKLFPYRYMEYEYAMMKREIEIMFPYAQFIFDQKEPQILNLKPKDKSKLNRLTFISGYSINHKWHDTYQCIVERTDTLKITKQHTRYSTHGIHEYKGKFNPQIVHCMINLFGLDKKSIIFDPFNGSGTTLLECAHLGIRALGTDINPLACLISNAKIKSLSLNISEAKTRIDDLINGMKSDSEIELVNDSRMAYLESWIPKDTLIILERIRNWTNTQSRNLAMLTLIIASDLIRDYSYQEPFDLRIRRRKTPFPEESFLKVFKDNIFNQFQKIEEIQNSLGIIRSSNEAINCDIKKEKPFENTIFDAALTSPPYMTALPYIDTQRISLVWLGMCNGNEIAGLDSMLIGSRELHKKEKDFWHDQIINNGYNLPKKLYSLVLEMQGSISNTDGFRKRAVPILLYRYLSEMKQMFLNLVSMLKINAPFALIVGHNKTTLGGKKYYINTPDLLSDLAIDCGWILEEIIPLDTYKRYGINSKNAIGDESLVILRNQKK